MVIRIENEITAEDLWFVLNNPWSISKLEWRLGDENNRKSMFSYIQDLLELAGQEGYTWIFKTKDNEPISILGCYRMTENNYTTFLVSSYHYEEYAMNLAFHIRQILREKTFDEKGFTLGIYSVSEHPHLFTWLRFLGFNYQPDGNVGNRRYFEFAVPSR